MTTTLLLASHPCSQCLTSRNRIVSGQRAAEIIKQCRSTGTHFQCHKSDENVHCRGVHDRFQSLVYHFALAIGIPIREVDTDFLGVQFSVR
jgi:hypothetical protein